MIFIPDDGVIVLDGRGQIAGDHLAGVMIHGQGHDVLGVVIPAIAGVAQQRDGVGDHGRLEGMLHVVLGLGVAHQPPTADVLHAVHISEKMVRHGGFSLTSIGFVL